MNRAKSYEKPIACLESFWNYDLVNRLSVIPILDLLSKAKGTLSAHLTCSTLEEFGFNLDVMKGMDRGILYLAFHGYPGGIYLPGLSVEIEYIATLMGKKFKDWIVFFDSCRTLDIEEQRKRFFVSETKVMMVIGFKRNLNWLDGAAVDLLVLDWLQSYKDK